MKIYFIKSTYNNGIYKLSDFYVGENYIQNPNKSQNIDLKINDGDTVTIVNSLLEDNTNVNEYSHILVPDYNKIYEIEKCIIINQNQTQIILNEDPFIGNYHSVKKSKLILERTNDISKFNGIHDVENIVVKKNIETQGTTITKTGQWIVYFIDYESVKNYTDPDTATPTQYIKIFDRGTQLIEEKFNSSSATVPHYYDEVPSLNDIKLKYPQVATNNPMSIDYFNKIIAADREYESIYYAPNRIIWKNRPFRYFSYENSASSDPIKLMLVNDLLVKRGDLLKSIKLAPDASMVALAFPLEFNIALSQSGHRMIMPYFSSVANGILGNDKLKIRGVKIFNETQIFPQETVVDYDGNLILNESEMNENGIKFSKTIKLENVKGISRIDLFYKDKVGNYKTFRSVNSDLSESYIFSCLVLDSLNTEVLLNHDLGTSLFDYEPFKNYIVTIFGQDFKVSRKNLETLKIKFAPSMSSIEFFGYIENDTSNKLFSGSYTNDVKWSIDELVLFNQENPTFKDQFTANILKKGINSSIGVAKGAAAGAIAGGPVGAIVGGGMAGLTSAINIGFDIHSEKLREKGLELRPDQIFGNSSAINLSSQEKYGIFLKIESSDFEENMKTQYNNNGFPTNLVTTIELLTPASNPIYGTNKLIKGRIIDQIKNKYITSNINKRLKEGVIVI